MTRLTLYHGSSRIIETPCFGAGNPHNDYGLGFYCTLHEELACEWACAAEGAGGFANKYVFDSSDLRMLDLAAEPYTILHWLALLVENRVFEAKTPVAVEGKRFLRERYLLPVEEYDVIRGYRADDSSFSFARAFLRNDISLEQLSRAMRLGNLGEQVVLKSPRVFERLRFEGARSASSEVYYPQRMERDENARRLYREEASRLGIGGLYLRDILQGGGNEGL